MDLIVPPRLLVARHEGAARCGSIVAGERCRGGEHRRRGVPVDRCDRERGGRAYGAGNHAYPFADQGLLGERAYNSSCPKADIKEEEAKEILEEWLQQLGTPHQPEE